MKIDDGFPKPSDFRDNEIATLKFLASDTQVATFCSNITSDAYASHLLLEHQVPKMRRKGLPVLDFESWLSIDSSVDFDALVIGGNVKATQDDAQYEEFTYYLALVKQSDNPPTLLRMFHFDYTPGNIAKHNPHPVFHLQYCGSFKPKLAELGIRKEDLDPLCPNVKVPRIASFPMSLALLFQFAVREFCSPNVADDILERSEWRAVVAKNERLILSPFFNNCANSCKKGQSDNSFWSDFCYGK